MHVVTLIPDSRYRSMLTPETDTVLDSLGRITRLHGDARSIGEAAPAALVTADVALTGWGTPLIQESWLDQAPSLRLICHCAGSIRGIIPPSVFTRGIQVAHAAPIIADAVAEFCILVELTLLRQMREVQTVVVTEEGWNKAKRLGTEGHLLGAQLVGLVGSGYVAQRHLRLLRAFGARVQIYDPYLTDKHARELGVIPCGLDKLFATSDVIAIHAPKTAETHHMIGSAQLRLIRPGAVLIQNSRSWVVDEAALLAELRTGRFGAAIDVFDIEPQPADSPFYQLPTVIATPHIAGATRES
ncbi:MAG: hydroxyacid dehydrogenase, partial [Chloroflexi bacterium]|nr:hydroxyacid dehydrogenase [Chloroflexota bacterium]